MPAVSLLKRPEEAETNRPAIKLKLLSGHMPVKRSINFATVGEKLIDWRVAAPAIVLIILIAGLISKITVYDRFAALNQARNEVYELQAQIASQEEYYNNLTDISIDYAHYTTSDMTEEETDRISRVTVMDVVQRLILPVAPLDGWRVTGNELSIHISKSTLTELTDMVNNLRADPAVADCTIVSQSATASSTEDVLREEMITADVTVVFKGTLTVIEENKAAKAAAEAAKAAEEATEVAALEEGGSAS